MGNNQEENSNFIIYYVWNSVKNFVFQKNGLHNFKTGPYEKQSTEEKQVKEKSTIEWRLNRTSQAILRKWST